MQKGLFFSETPSRLLISHSFFTFCLSPRFIKVIPGTMSGRRRRLNETINPPGSPNLAQRIIALQNAQLSHSGGKKPKGGRALVMPEALRRQVDDTPQPVKQTLLKAKQSQEMWLVDSDTWEKMLDWPDDTENDTPGLASKKNGFSPESLTTRDAVRPGSGKTQEQGLPLRESSYHLTANETNSAFEAMQGKIDAFLSSVSLLAPPGSASKEEREELGLIVNMATANLKKKEGMQTATGKDTNFVPFAENGGFPVEPFDDFLQSLSSGSSTSDGVTDFLRSMWEDANEAPIDGSKQDVENFEKSFRAIDWDMKKERASSGKDDWFPFPTGEAKGNNILRAPTERQLRDTTTQSSKTSSSQSVNSQRSGKSRKRIPVSESVPFMPPSRVGRRRGVLGIEERVDGFEAAEESPRGTDIAVRSIVQNSPTELSVNSSPSEKEMDFAFDTIATRKDHTESVDLSRFAASKQSFPGKQLSSSFTEDQSDMLKSHGFIGSSDDSLVLSLRRRLDQDASPAPPPQPKVVASTAVEAILAYQVPFKHREDPPASSPAIAERSRNAPIGISKSGLSSTERSSPQQVQQSSLAPVPSTAPYNTQSSLGSALQASNSTVSKHPRSPSWSFPELKKRSILQMDTESASDGENSETSVDASVDAVHQGVRSMEPNRSGSNSSDNVGDNCHERQSSSHLSDVSPQSAGLTPTSRSVENSFEDRDRPPKKRGYASDPIRNYWRNFADVKTWGSFDSVSFVKDANGVRSRPVRIDRPSVHFEEQQRIDTYDYGIPVNDFERMEMLHDPRGDACFEKQDEIDDYGYAPQDNARQKAGYQDNGIYSGGDTVHDIYEEEGFETVPLEDERMKLTTRPIQYRVANGTKYLRSARRHTNEVPEELPGPVADQQMYVMGPMLSGDTDLETEYTDEETTKTGRDAEDAAQKECGFMCGGLELSLKGFPGFSCYN